MKTLCIYHAKCADGFGAAWVVHQALGDEVEFYAAHHGTPAPAVVGLDVVIVDFSYPSDVILQLAKQARSVLIIDHHKTAAEALAQLPAAPASYGAWLDSQQALGTVFDMDRSGAGLTWDFFNPGQPRPGLINHIEDRDLWRFALPHTREIQTALFSLPYSFELWGSFMDHPETLIHDGIAIERKHHKDVAELVDASKRRMVIGGIDVPVANLPYTLSSDAGHLMGQGEPFAACYMDTPRGRVFSLRSAPDGLDVSAIAKQYGGGGHQHAAGFQVPFEHPLACNAPALKCYQVGEQDVVAAYTPEQAVAILCAFSGYPAGEYTVDDVSEWTDAQLDAPVFEEDGVTPAEPWRATFAACVYPQYLCGWE